MDWSNETFVKLYTRDTATWKLLEWQGRTVLLHLFRKVDRAGVLEVGELGVEGLAAVVELPLEIVEPGIEQLTSRPRQSPTVVWTGSAYLLPNFISAQDAAQSDPQRKRESRARRRDRALFESRFVTSAARPLALPAGDLESLAIDLSETEPSASRFVTTPSGFVTDPGRPVTTGHSEIRLDQKEVPPPAGARAIPPSPVRTPEPSPTPSRPQRSQSTTPARTSHVQFAWSAAKVRHDLLRSSGIDPHAISWTAMPTGIGMSDLLDRSRELQEAGDDEFVRETFLRVIEVRAAEATRLQHLKYFIASRMFERESFWKAAEQSPQQAAAPTSSSRMPAQPRGLRVVRDEADDAPPPVHPAFRTRKP